MDDADGQRVDATFELVSRITAAVGGSNVWRLRITGDELPNHLLITPAYDVFPVPEETGGTYRVQNAVLVTNHPENASTVDARCPECGGALRAGTAVDALGDAVKRATRTVDIPTPVLVADESTTIAPDGGDTLEQSGRHADPIQGPESVCTACDALVESTPDC